MSWLDRLNEWRASTGLPSLTENATWSQGDYDHAVYMVKNGLVTHYETPGTPYYTADGDTAARNSNIQVSSTTATTDTEAIDWWMGAPFHAMGMMDPRLTTTGFGSYRDSTTSPWQEGGALDVLRGNPFTGGQYPVYFPGNGTTEPLTQYSGSEFPDPLQACSGYANPTGLPVFVQVGGNVATSVSAHSFAGNGTQLAHCVIDSNSPSVGSDLTGRGGVIVIPRQPLQAGVKYAVALTVNGVAYSWSFTVGPFFGVSSVSPDFGPPSGGTAVTITGTGFTGTTSVKFGATAAASFTVANDATINAVSPAHAVGTVDLTVTNASGTSLITSSDHFTYGPCASVTASASPASPKPSGTPITFTGSASGCFSPNPLYEFWMLPAGSSTWQLVQSYSTNATYPWNSTGAVAGTVNFSVWVRDAASLGTGCNTAMGCYDAFVSIPYQVTPTVCTSVAESASPASPASAGTPVVFTATAATCPNARFEFWMRPAGSTAWQVVQGYGPSSTYSWNSTGAVAGVVYFSVWARDISSAAAYDTYTSIPYTVTAGAACASTTVSASPTNVTQSSSGGTHVTITAAATGCPNGPRYEFWMRPAGWSTWMLVQGYGTRATFDWNSTGAAAGTVYFSAWVRDATSGAAYNAFASTPVTVTASPTCGSVTVSASPTSVAHGSGAHVTITAASTGCPNSPRYEFWMRPAGSSAWQLVQGYGTSATYDWNSAGAASGTVYFSAWVRDANSAASYDAFASTPVTVS